MRTKICVGTRILIPSQLYISISSFRNKNDKPYIFTAYLLFIFMCVDILPECASVYHICVWYQWWLEEGVAVPATRVSDVCELPSGC